MRRVLWFAGLYLAGLLVLGSIAMVILAVLL